MIYSRKMMSVRRVEVFNGQSLRNAKSVSFCDDHPNGLRGDSPFWNKFEDHRKVVMVLRVMPIFGGSTSQP